MLDDVRWDSQMRRLQEAVEAAPANAAAALAVPFDGPRAHYERARLAQIDRGGPAHLRCENIWIAAWGRRILARLYQTEGPGTQAVLVYFHGGGWVWGSVDTHDRLCREYAAGAGMAVLSVDYSLAPENPFPRAVDEAVAVCRWIVAGADGGPLSGRRIVLGGDSSGANVALGASRVLQDEAHVLGMLANYPVCTPNFESPSYHEFANGYGLTRDSMQFFWQAYDPGFAHRADPRIDLLNGAWHGAVPSYLVLAELDVLRSEGEALHGRLVAAGCESTLDIVQGVNHGFLLYPDRLDAARAAIGRSTAWLIELLQRGDDGDARR